MKNKKAPTVLIFLGVICALFSSVDIMAQGISKAKSELKNEARITWDDEDLRVKETQAVVFKEGILIKTTVSLFTNGHRVTQTMEIPISKLDTKRTQSYPHSKLEGMHYLLIYINNDEKAVKTTTVYENEGQEPTQNIVYTSYFTIYSKTKMQSLTLMEKFQRLGSNQGN
jgi:hypothetical protein